MNTLVFYDTYDNREWYYASLEEKVRPLKHACFVPAFVKDFCV